MDQPETSVAQHSESKIPEPKIQAMFAQGDWPQRVGMLALIGAIAGVIIYGITEMPKSDNPELGFAAIAFTAVLAASFGFVVERGKFATAALYALIIATVCSLVVYLNSGSDDFDWDAFRISSIILASGIATPLFQAWQDGGGNRFNLRLLDYQTIHDRAWTNVVLFGTSWAITGVFVLMLLLISQLFGLIKIDLLEDLMRESGFMFPLLGGSFAAVVGILRDREKILSTLQSVLRKVASFFTPVLAVALVLFLCSLPFTGLAPLWEATSNTSGIIMAVAAAGALFINILIGDSTEDEAKAKIFRWTAQALAISLLPLGLIAAYSISLRIGQYGLTPERLWGIVFVGVALAYAAVYLVILIRKRSDWMPHIRRANVMLAASLCALAFILALPFISFGAISTRSQLAMLNSGQVTAEKFDWAALRYDFGPSGRDAVDRLAKEGKTVAIKTAALNAKNSENRWTFRNDQDATRARLSLDERLIILPQKIALPDDLRSALTQYGRCSDDNNENSRCLIFYTAGANRITGMNEECYGDTKRCGIRDFQIVKKADGWENDNGANAAIVPSEPRLSTSKPGDVEIRNVTRQQIFINGKPVGDAFE